MKETDLYEQLARYMNLNYPGVIYHFDSSGINNPSKYSRAQYSRLNGRGYPDMFIAKPKWDASTNQYTACGLYLEIKKEGTRLKKRDGEWANAHIAEQATTLLRLRASGYPAEFGVGLDACIKLIEEYLG